MWTRVWLKHDDKKMGDSYQAYQRVTLTSRSLGCNDTKRSLSMLDRVTAFATSKGLSGFSCHRLWLSGSDYNFELAST